MRNTLVALDRHRRVSLCAFVDLDSPCARHRMGAGRRRPGPESTVSGDVHRYGFPRTDLSVTLDGVTIKPALALGGWVAFADRMRGAMVHGRSRFTPSEINPVMAKDDRRWIEDTLQFTHRPGAAVETFYMRICWLRRSRQARDLHPRGFGLRSKLQRRPVPQTHPPPIDLDGQLSSIIGVKGQANGGVYQFNVPRRDPVTEDGMKLNRCRARWVWQLPLTSNRLAGGGKAAITGDFVLTKQRSESVIVALRAHGIEVTALHSHVAQAARHFSSPSSGH